MIMRAFAADEANAAPTLPALRVDVRVVVVGAAAALLRLLLRSFSFSLMR